MKRTCIGGAVALALLGAAVVILPHVASAAPAKAGAATIHLVSAPRVHTTLNGVTGARVTRTTSRARFGHSGLRASGRLSGAVSARGRYTTGRTRLSATRATGYTVARYSRLGYVGASRYSATGTTHHCPNMGTYRR